MNEYLDQVAEAIWRATIPAAAEKGITFNEMAEHSREVFRRMAQAAIDALGLTEEWGALSPREDEPHIVFDFPGTARESAQKVATARISQGMSADVVSRLVSPWVQAGAR